MSVDRTIPGAHNDAYGDPDDAGDSRGAVSDIYTREPTDVHVAVVHGYGAQVKIHHGQLALRDGIGRHQRERSYGKADRTLRRIVITAVHGYVTLEALAWCKDHDIAITTLDPDGELVSAWSAEPAMRDVRLLRRQATADGLEIARAILMRKVRGQADVILKTSGNLTVHDAINRHADRMETAEVISELSDQEGFAAREYFQHWAETVRIAWKSPADTARIPVNWLTYPGRQSPIAGSTGKKYNASDPVNALLNYAYAIGLAECRSACVAHGLESRLGFIHKDKTGRDSLALDVLEALRPEIDTYILGLISSRKFTWRDFHEPSGYTPGTVRLCAPLTHEIAEQIWNWHKTADETCSLIVNMLTGSREKHGTAMRHWNLQRDQFRAENVTAADVLTDTQWDSISALIPAWDGATFRPPVDPKIIIAAMVYMRYHNRPLAHVPPSFGVSHRTLLDRRRRWMRSGVWPEIDAAISDAAAEYGANRSN